MQHQKYHVMENKIKKIVVFIMLSSSCFAQKTILDTLKMFEGHWVFKMAINTDYTPQELENTYIKDVRGGKIHIKGNRMYGNYEGNLYQSRNISLSNIESNSGEYLNNESFEKKDLEELERLGIKNQTYILLNEKENDHNSLLYGTILLLPSQQYLIDGMDQTMFFLERDKTEYGYIKVKNTPILHENGSRTLNEILENEEVEIIAMGQKYSKIRYWGKALILGWIETKDLKAKTAHPEYWNIYKNNIIKFQIINSKSIILNDNFQKTNVFLKKGDTIEILEEKGYFLKIKYNNIIGIIPRVDVEGFNTFRITISKSLLNTAPNKPTRMYLLKGDDVELLDRQDDWLKIRYRGKKTIEGWIKKSDVE